MEAQTPILGDALDSLRCTQGPDRWKVLLSMTEKERRQHIELLCQEVKKIADHFEEGAERMRDAYRWDADQNDAFEDTMVDIELRQNAMMETVKLAFLAQKNAFVVRPEALEKLIMIHTQAQILAAVLEEKDILALPGILELLDEEIDFEKKPETNPAKDPYPPVGLN